MTTNEQRIAIAEACGWIRAYEEGDDEGCGKWFWHKGSKNLKQPPDYLNDLNAMHEAEKVFLKMETLCFWETYSNRLTTSLGCTDIFHATAAQKSKAFLQTLGLWTATPTQPQ